MNRTELLQEIRKMRFAEAYAGWQGGRLRQEEAARLLGVCERTFRRSVDRYEDEGLPGLIDKRLEQVSPRKARVDEVMALVDRYRGRHPGWNVKHCHAWYRKEGGTRRYTWVKERLQAAGEVQKASARGKHRQRRERAAWPGMLLHQDASTHAWVPGVKWDRVITMDDATHEHDAIRFVAEAGTASSLLGVRDVIERRGRFAARYTDRGSHDWHTPEAGGQVDKRNPTPFGKAMARLGIEMIAAYSPEARGRSARRFRTHPGRLVQELTRAGITERQGANGYLEEIYRPAFNAQFMPPALAEGSACVPWIGGDLDDFLCETDERVVGKDNGVTFEGMALQIPQDRHRRHYVKVKVRVHRYPDGRLALFHGPRCLVHFDAKGRLIPPKIQAVAEVRRAPRGGALRAIALRAFPPRQSERTVYVLLNRTVLFVANSAARNSPGMA